MKAARFTAVALVLGLVLTIAAPVLAEEQPHAGTAGDSSRPQQESAADQVRKLAEKVNACLAARGAQASGAADSLAASALPKPYSK